VANESSPRGPDQPSFILDAFIEFEKLGVGKSDLQMSSYISPHRKGAKVAWFDKPRPERTVHPSRASGRTVSRRAHHDRLKPFALSLSKGARTARKKGTESTKQLTFAVFAALR